MEIPGAQMSKKYLVVKNSMSWFVLSSILLDVTSSSTSCEISGRLLLLPPRLRLEEVEDELKPESGTGDAEHSRRKSKPPPEHNRETGVCVCVRRGTGYVSSFECLILRLYAAGTVGVCIR